MKTSYRSGDRIRAAMAELVRRSRESQRSAPGPLLRRHLQPTTPAEPLDDSRFAAKPATGKP